MKQGRKPASRTAKGATRSSDATKKTRGVSRGPGGGKGDQSLPVISPVSRKRAAALAEALAEAYPTAHCELAYRTPHELLVATILSAQATDAGVNKATPGLFARFPAPADYARASAEEIEPYIRSIGLFRNKARAIHAAMKEVVERFGGEVPRTMEELLTLRGVARKTANVVLGNAYGINEGFVVDTHIERLAKRFCLVEQDAKVPAIERALMQLFPRESWCDLSHRLIWHGRRACKARQVAGVSCERHPICARFGACCEYRSSGGIGGATGSRGAPRGGRSA